MYRGPDAGTSASICLRDWTTVPPIRAMIVPRKFTSWTGFNVPPLSGKILCERNYQLAHFPSSTDVNHL